MKKSRLAYFLRPLDTMKRLADKRYRGIKLDDLPPQLLNASTLQAADVLFCRGDKRSFSWRMIAYGSSGHYVHAAIYLGDGLVAEATTKGVQACTLAEFTRRYAYVAVTRSPGISRNPTLQNDVLRFCEKHIQARTPYSLPGALLSPWLEFYELCKMHWRYSPLKARPPRKSKRTFCSQFVLDAFIAGGDFAVEHLNSAAHSPTSLAETYCFSLAGYLCVSGELASLVEDDVLWTGGG
ncbi:hypothetical protein [Vagococcus sp. WN89Y]|uniref:hypothetical protein n=1 Tax=Vagococcus sp. WN89Y TaxID=3457258 RepID=UPI003FCDCB32